MDTHETRRGFLVFLALSCLILTAIAIRLPGVHWLIGYGPNVDFSFNPDAHRFIVFADHFHAAQANRNGYPPFMVVQLFLIDAFLHKVGAAPNAVIVLRSISMVYSAFSLILSYVFLTSLGFSRLTGILASFFLAISPLHIIFSHFGTADMSAFFLFYMTAYAAWRHQRSHREHWFFITAALAGLAIADKFFLPALVPLSLIILSQPSHRVLASSFVAGCIFVTFFCFASFFNYTPWDFKNLIDMLFYDNLFVSGGKSPPQQLLLYSWDLVACAGVATTTLAAFGGIIAIHDWGARESFHSWKKRLMRETTIPDFIDTVRSYLRSPNSVIPLALLCHAVLIVTAQVHFPRHILVFVPVICFLAAFAAERIFFRLMSTRILTRSVGITALISVLTLQLVNGFATDWVYSTDIRAKLSQFLDENHFASQTSTTSGFYTHLKNVSVIKGLATSPFFISCDLEYNRYMSAARGVPTFHVFGGKVRTDFFVSLFSGRAGYVPIFHIKRQRFSIEDHLAEIGLLPNIGTDVPNECIAFQKEKRGKVTLTN